MLRHIINPMGSNMAPRHSITPLKLRRFGKAKLTVHKDKYLLFHVPIGLSNLLEIKKDDEVEVFASFENRTIILKLTKST